MPPHGTRPRLANRPIRVQNDLAINAVGDYLRLAGMQVRIRLRTREPALQSDTILAADVADLSDSGTHLVLTNVRARRRLRPALKFPHFSLPVANILQIEILDRRGRDP